MERQKVKKGLLRDLDELKLETPLHMGKIEDVK